MLQLQLPRDATVKFNLDGLTQLYSATAAVQLRRRKESLPWTPAPDRLKVVTSRLLSRTVHDHARSSDMLRRTSKVMESDGPTNVQSLSII